jgi:hypothetical protein
MNTNRLSKTMEKELNAQMTKEAHASLSFQACPGRTEPYDENT